MLLAALIKARQEQGLSQKDVAERMSVAQPTVAGFERHDNDPKLSTIRRYAHAVGATISHTVIRDDAVVSPGWDSIDVDVAFTVHTGPARTAYTVAAPTSAPVGFGLAA